MKTKLEIKCERNRYAENYYVIEIDSKTYFTTADFSKIQKAIGVIKAILDPLIEKEIAEKSVKEKIVVKS